MWISVANNDSRGWPQNLRKVQPLQEQDLAEQSNMSVHSQISKARGRVMPLEDQADAYNPSVALPPLRLSVSEAPDVVPDTVACRQCKIDGNKDLIRESYREELYESGNSVMNNLKQPKGEVAKSGPHTKSGFPAGTVPRYINLEPSLAMDWLEISWEELHIKERVGAGTFLFMLIRHISF